MKETPLEAMAIQLLNCVLTMGDSECVLMGSRDLMRLQFVQIRCTNSTTTQLQEPVTKAETPRKDNWSDWPLSIWPWPLAPQQMAARHDYL